MPQEEAEAAPAAATLTAAAVMAPAAAAAAAGASTGRAGGGSPLTPPAGEQLDQQQYWMLVTAYERQLLQSYRAAPAKAPPATPPAHQVRPPSPGRRDHPEPSRLPVLTHSAATSGIPGAAGAAQPKKISLFHASFDPPG